MHATYTFALLKQREIDACATLAREAVAEWQAGWRAGAGIGVSCGAASDNALDSGEGQWYAHGPTPDAALWCHRPAAFDKQIGRLIFGLDDVSRSKDRRSESDIADSVALEAVEDLIATLLSRVNQSAVGHLPEAAEPPPWQFRRSAGAALLKVVSGSLALHILVPNGSLPALERPAPAGSRAQLSPLATALTGIQARLTAQLGEVDMTLGQLTSLALGDVISLQVGLDQPLKLFAGKGHMVALGHLGKQNGYRALEIFAATKK